MALIPLATQGNYLHIYDFRVKEGMIKEFIRLFNEFDYGDDNPMHKSPAQVRDGVLVQNALSANDGYCSAAKGAALLQAVLDTVDICQELVARGVPPATVDSFDFSTLLRLRESAGPSDAEGVSERAAAFLAGLKELQ